MIMTSYQSEELVTKTIRRPYHMDSRRAKEFGVIDKVYLRFIYMLVLVMNHIMCRANGGMPYPGSLAWSGNYYGGSCSSRGMG